MPLPQPNPFLDEIIRVPEGSPERKGLLRLDRNERVSSFADDVYRAMLDSLDPETLICYPDPGPLYQRLSLALSVPIDWLLLTSGSDGGVRAACHAYVRPGDKVVMLDPSYVMYAIYTRMFGGEPRLVSYRTNRDLDTHALADAIQPGTRLVMLAEPNQPTGTLLPDGILQAVMDRAEHVGALVVVDEAYFPFSGRTAVPLLATSAHLVILRTFSKAAGLAGLRLGYAVGQPKAIAALVKVRGAYDANGVAICLASYLLDHPEIVEDYMAEVEMGRKVLERAARFGVQVLPSATNFQLLRVGPQWNPGELVKALRQEGILVKGPFDAPCLRDCIRVTLGPPAVMQQFLDVLMGVLPQLSVLRRES